ncbi:MAG: FGGY family carbohydrate kinase, partial [Candidatus Hodarchaeota archaeon]
MNYFLAIDLGTQSIRAAIVDQNGLVSSVSQIQQDVNSPFPGWAQQKPQVWWDLTKRAILEVIQKSKVNTNSIKGVSTCGQMHGPVGVNKDGEIT